MAKVYLWELMVLTYNILRSANEYLLVRVEERSKHAKRDLEEGREHPCIAKRIELTCGG